MLKWKNFTSNPFELAFQQTDEFLVSVSLLSNNKNKVYQKSVFLFYVESFVFIFTTMEITTFFENNLTKMKTKTRRECLGQHTSEETNTKMY